MRSGGIPSVVIAVVLLSSRSCLGASFYCDRYYTNPDEIVQVAVNGTGNMLLDVWDVSLLPLSSNTTANYYSNRFAAAPQGALLARISVAALAQSTPSDAGINGLKWRWTMNFTVHTSWENKMLLLRLGTDGGIWPLTVASLPGASPKRITLIHPTQTWMAYNGFGGYSFYGNSLDSIVNMYRPIKNWDTWSLDLIMYAFLRAKNISFNVFTDLELEFGCGPLMDGALAERQLPRILVIHGHLEYVTERQMMCIHEFLDSGNRLIYVGGNALWGKVVISGMVSNLLQSNSLQSNTSQSNTAQSNKTQSNTSQSAAKMELRRATKPWKGLASPARHTLPGHEGEYGGYWGDLSRAGLVPPSLHHPSAYLGVWYDAYVCKGVPFEVSDDKHWAVHGLSSTFGDRAVPPAFFSSCNPAPNQGAAGHEVDLLTEESPCGAMRDDIATSKLIQEDGEWTGPRIQIFPFEEGIVFSCGSLGAPWAVAADSAFGSLLERIVIVFLNQNNSMFKFGKCGTATKGVFQKCCPPNKTSALSTVSILVIVLGSVVICLCCLSPVCIYWRRRKNKAILEAVLENLDLTNSTYSGAPISIDYELESFPSSSSSNQNLSSSDQSLSSSD